MEAACSRSSSQRYARRSLTATVGYGSRQSVTSSIPIHTRMRPSVCSAYPYTLPSDAEQTTAHSLAWYKFIGRILGKAIYDGILVNVVFAGFFLAKVRYLIIKIGTLPSSSARLVRTDIDIVTVAWEIKLLGRPRILGPGAVQWTPVSQAIPWKPGRSLAEFHHRH